MQDGAVQGSQVRYHGGRGGELPAHQRYRHRHRPIFEKGYTGGNGRLERSASHLGLYLTHKAADLLPIPVRVESRRGQGTTFTLCPEQGREGIQG